MRTSFLHRVVYVGAALAVVAFLSLDRAGPELFPEPEKSPGAKPPKARQAVVAGTFYPGDRATLSQTLGDLLSRAKLPGGPARELIGLVAPHAGYAYSGPVAAHAYLRVANEKPELVIVVAPSHYVEFDGFAVLDDDVYRTPLGDVPLDREGAAWLRARSPHFAVREDAWAREHAMEVQLPWLQQVVPGARVLPIVMGRQDLPWCQALAESLAALLAARAGRALLVASSDLSHFHKHAEARALDAKLAERLEAFDPEGVHRGARLGSWEACGLGPVTAVMLAARTRGASIASRLDLRNSGDVTGELDRVVGYGAWALEGPEPRPGSSIVSEATTAAANGARPRLAQRELETLMALARKAVEAAVNGSVEPELPPAPGVLGQLGGAFVTLKQKGELRGCIGQVDATLPLVEAVRHVARLAALEDPRFPAVTAAELPGLEFELTVLGPMSPVADPNAIELGRHGIMVLLGNRSGLFLPQVPVEQGWDRETYLAEVCRKAGLPRDAWKKGALLMSFEGQVYPGK